MAIQALVVTGIAMSPEIKHIWCKSFRVTCNSILDDDNADDVHDDDFKNCSWKKYDYFRHNKKAVMLLCLNRQASFTEKY